MRYWAECGSLIRECRRHFRSTGAFLPSSRFLGRALVSELRKARGSSRILEVGPGTGSVTAQILRLLRPDDHLDAVEINGEFIALLERRFEQERSFRRHRDQVRLIHAPVEELIGDRVYDFIISGLPLNNFPAAQVRAIFRAFSRLLKPGGMLSYFEYVFVRQLKTPFASRRERRRLFGVGRAVKRYIGAYQFRRQHVLINVPPAIVRHLRFAPDSEPQPDERSDVRRRLRARLPRPRAKVPR
jgi:phospholipid N-methyltransferase